MNGWSIDEWLLSYIHRKKYLKLLKIKKSCIDFKIWKFIKGSEQISIGMKSKLQFTFILFFPHIYITFCIKITLLYISLFILNVYYIF